MSSAPSEGPKGALGAAGASRGARRFRAARWSALAVGLAAVVLVSVLATRQPATMVTAQSPLVGKGAPAIAAKTFSGSPVTLRSMRGHWVLVNFFASWCDACRQEDPQLEQFYYSRAGGSRPEVLGVLYGDTASDGASFQREQGANWPSVVDPGGLVAANYGVGALPRSFLVDPAGKIVASILGAVTLTGLERLIQQQRAPAA